MNTQTLVSQVGRTITRHGLLRADARVIVALSGGADSVALLRVMLQLGYDCLAAHCNFHLRGAESNRDMKFVQQLCAELDVDLAVTDFDVDARRRQTGESVEMACRALRYEWFDSLLERERAQAIVVGHHREDNAETLLLNLLRGTGPRGLCGMRYRHGFVVRPMLDCTRAQIETYLHECGAGWVDDSSNTSEDYRRNRLRHSIIPAMEQGFCGAVEALTRTAAQVTDSMALYDQLVAERAAQYRDGSDILLSRLVADERHARMLLYEMLRTEGFNMSVIEDMVAAAQSSGQSFTSNTGTVRELSRGRLSLRTADTADSGRVSVSLTRDILTPVHIIVERLPIAKFKPERDAAVAYFDAAVVGRDDLYLRPWQRGDRLEPYGMDGSKLVSDLMNDAGYSAAQKRNLRLLCCGDTILWVPGLRSSRHFTVGPGTKEFVKLTYASR